MKIAYIIPSLANKGPIVATQRLIQALQTIKGVEIELYYFDDVIELDIAVNKHRISFVDKIEFDKFDIIHSTGLRPDLYLLKNRSKVARKCVSSVHCYITEDLSMLYGKLKSAAAVFFWKIALKRMQAIVVSSNFMANYYKKLLHKNNAVVIPYAVQLPQNSEIDAIDLGFMEDLRAKYTVIGNVSLLIKRKGLEQLIALLKIRPNYAVVIIGDGELKDELLQQANYEKVADRFFILGFKESSYRYYKYFDIYAMPSRSEGFSLATLEAFASSIPVISTRLPYYEEFFNEEEICFFDLDNISSLSKATDWAFQNSSQIANNALKVFNKLFTVGSLAQSHFELYTTIKEHNTVK